MSVQEVVCFFPNKVSLSTNLVVTTFLGMQATTTLSHEIHKRSLHWKWRLCTDVLSFSLFVLKDINIIYLHICFSEITKKLLFNWNAYHHIHLIIVKIPLLCQLDICLKPLWWGVNSVFHLRNGPVEWYVNVQLISIISSTVLLSFAFYFP